MNIKMKFFLLGVFLSSIVSPAHQVYAQPNEQKSDVGLLGTTGVMEKKASVILLGTAGGPALRKSRSQPASLLIVDGQNYLIDVGAGTSRQLALVDKDVTDLKAVFITHHHLDHTAGLASILGLRWAANMVGFATSPLQIYGPPGTGVLGKAATDYFSVSETIFRTQAPSAPKFSEIFNTYDVVPGLIYEDENISVAAIENSHYSTVDMPETSHGVDRSYSLRVDTKYGSIVFSGDTGPSDKVVELAKDADILVSEIVDIEQTVSFMQKNQNISEDAASMMAAHMEHEHLPPNQLGKLAAQAGVKRLVLSHYAVLDESNDVIDNLVREIKEYYKGPVIAGRDFDVFHLPGRPENSK